jgi:hypothetical protein
MARARRFLRGTIVERFWRRTSLSRAFVNEDAAHEPEPRFDLPDRDAPHYDEAAAWALLEGANMGFTRAAETATGYRWGEPRLTPHIQAILVRADEEGEDRLAQLARRFLKATGTESS